MPSLDGIQMQRPTLDSIRQASSGALDKAKLMVGLKEEDLESQQSERSLLDEAVDLLCPQLSFQQVSTVLMCFDSGMSHSALSINVANDALFSRLFFFFSAFNWFCQLFFYRM